MTVQLPVGTTQLVTRIPKNKHALVLALCSALCVAPAFALEQISDADMSNATGEGIAFFAKDFQLQAQQGTYINLMPIGPAAGGQKANIFIYGLSISQDNGDVAASGSGAGLGAHNNLFGAPIGSWGTALNPFALAVDPNTAGAPGMSTSSTANVYTPNLLLTAPALNLTQVNGVFVPNSDDSNKIRLGLWMDLEQLNTTANASDRSLQIQGIWDGLSINGTKISLFATPNDSPTTTLKSTLGINGVLRFNTQTDGVLRLSVAHLNNGIEGQGVSGINDQAGIYTTDPQFDPIEGVWIPRAAINLPLGQPNYQPLVLQADSTGVYLELARIQNNSAAYGAFYTNYDDPTAASILAKNCSQINCRPTATHGSIALGDVYYNNSASAGVGGTPAYSYNAQYTSAGTAAGNNVNGVIFKAPVASGGASVNLGTAAIDGLMIQHMKMTLTGL